MVDWDHEPTGFWCGGGGFIEKKGEREERGDKEKVCNFILDSSLAEGETPHPSFRMIGVSG